AKGMLVADGVPVGATRFAVRHPAFAVAEVREQPVRADVPIRVELRGTGDLELTVTERGVRPPEMVSLLILPRFGGDIDPLIPPKFVRTDDQGKVVIHGMQPGKWRIQLAPPLRDLVSPNDFMKLMMESRFRGTRSEVTILEGQLVRSSFELDGDAQRLAYTGSIHFKIQKNGRPLQGAIVGVNGTSSDSATTDAQGMCSMDHLQDGTYWVSVNVGDTIPPMTLWSDNVTLKDGQRVDRIVDIMTGGARVSVRDLSGLPLPGVSVQIRAEGNGWHGGGGLTDDAGVVEVAELAEGDYTCRVDLRETDRESMIVPAVKLTVRHAQVATVELRAIKPVKLAGTVVLDVSSLTGRARELALENKPNGGQFISEDSGSSNNWRSWQRFREWDDALLEAPLRELTLAPGSYNFQTWGSSLQWTCAPLSVIAPSMPAMRIVLRPDQATLDALVKADADAKAKKNTQGK
ncbi:MAG: hypothetical protein KDC95_19780, partial [Planctomycetes bacterium]|nr:hypothetical protein [Planctomycetota bacterium]